jgi:hypothetical protein
MAACGGCEAPNGQLKGIDALKWAMLAVGYCPACVPQRSGCRGMGALLA